MLCRGMSSPPPEPSKAELLVLDEATFDTETLAFVGLRGDQGRHWLEAELVEALAKLPAAPQDEGRLDAIVARGASGERQVLETSSLSVADGLPLDRWRDDERYGPEYQLATARTDVARLIARGQPLELHGDNLYLSLDLSRQNLPIGSQLQIGDARLVVTPQAHNGCRKWVQRFGLAPMQLNLAPGHRDRRLRGLYLRVVEPGRIAVGDRVTVVSRAATPT